MVVVVAAFAVWPELEQSLAPEPVQAWVAIEPEGAGIATVGPVVLAEGQPFTLHAVLEAKDRHGERVFYTEAPALEWEGERVAGNRLLTWRGDLARILWFTVEGASPVLFLEPGESVELFGYREFLRPDWGSGWQATGGLHPANDQHLDRRSLLEPEPFGLQRFHVRIELYQRRGDLVPKQRYASWGVAELRPNLERFPAVVRELDGPLARASGFFGLSEIVPPKEAEAGLLNALAELTGKRLAYSRLTLLRDLVRAGGEPEWRRLDLTLSPEWGETVRPGDLLRVGSRFVVLFRDEGEPLKLDDEDLCLDFHLGPRVGRLGQVFEGDGELEWAPVAREEPGS